MPPASSPFQRDDCGWNLTAASLEARGALPERAASLMELSLPFATGMAFHVWRSRIRLHYGIAAALGLGAAALKGTPVFHEAFALALSYAVFVLAYLPGGAIRRWNGFGDWSYGIYIYAFPAQQLAVHLFGPMTPAQNIAIAFPVALICAMLSWRWIEKPALALRRRGAGRGVTRA